MMTMNNLVLVALVFALVWLTPTASKAKQYEYDLSGPITATSDDQLQLILSEAKRGDVVLINLNTIGGDAYEAYDIVTAMNASKATVAVHVDGVAYSAGFMILLSADYISMTKGTLLMMHTIQDAEKNIPITQDNLHEYGNTKYLYNWMMYYLKAKGVHNRIGSKQWAHFINGKDIYFTKELFEQTFMSKGVR